MTLNAADLITDCLVALGDESAVTWARTVILPWCVEAVQSFPILRPKLFDYTAAGASLVYMFDLPADFRQIISVEYPINSVPPKYHARKNHLDPAFFNQVGFYDVDHNYADGIGWMCHVSEGVRLATHAYIQYMATHDTSFTDSDEDELTIPDEYNSILITSVMCRAYRNRLSLYMQDPTAHMSVITQMTEMVQHIEELFRSLVADAQRELTNSIVSPRMVADKFDQSLLIAR